MSKPITKDNPPAHRENSRETLKAYALPPVRFRSVKEKRKTTTKIIRHITISSLIFQSLLAGKFYSVFNVLRLLIQAKS